ncbi:hypothetical protein MJO28_005308 [Puccinia striiformis f. sp. tritici]|uniref:YbgI/family dinuclear metal center protein n=2 Tax=Puccinia striiformis TaxID=27350 RepID=A0A2S4WB39_9BASI|nr:hypothetical protein Pst134EA_009465 [Puccinia striiformis f. sp. tritici]KAH9468941.1 hypothetical protein Pst134EA_009465 [Puccinia striiformis f. sp. tritici]KAI7954908.1 hypothetical protein MJO28_005308 [Puccinia striiformis f. sp. tritici]KAI9622958.1 hypothetical protein H4Q26_014899 [Puccinia striiformis f. sp. tritici PST-130]POW18984.1 hypothetical protein PSHT_05152 [Puccinia striiformis]
MSLIKAVQRAFSKMAPVSLAESWDNTGLLLESPVVRPLANKVLLTIDLTPSVAEEALAKDSNIGVIVAYHPTIFRGLKSLTLNDPLQEVILKCAAGGISVYSPHTALDSVIGGINDELCEIVSGLMPHQNQIYSASGAIVEKNSDNILNGVGLGGGRRVEFQKGKEVELDQLISRIKTGLGLSHVQLAKSSVATPKIRSVGVCAGSGGSICSALGKSCDAFVTGEMSHHELLSANAQGIHVILTAHTNTERFFLARVLRPRLQQLLAEEAVQLSADQNPQWDVDVSTMDRDPLVVV